jgi:hypothetical protein
MLDDDEVVKRGIALYDGTMPYNVKIVKSSFLYGTGDYEDPEEIREDREIECYYIWCAPPGPPDQTGRPFTTGGGAFLTLAEAMKHVEKATYGTVRWQEEE